MKMIFALLLLVAFQTRAQNAIEFAYASIPHSRTPFDQHQSILPKNERLALEKLFTVIDELVVQRVAFFIWLKGGMKKEAAAEDHYDEILLRLEKISMPNNLKKTKDLVLAAARDQRDYLRTWKAALEKDGKFAEALGAYKGTPAKVLSSSQAISAAYSELMNHQPKESEFNRKAFYDGLFALDFL
jgi:hypothetical protein